jgi:hypothetical protein
VAGRTLNQRLFSIGLITVAATTLAVLLTVFGVHLVHGIPQCLLLFI